METNNFVRRCLNAGLDTQRELTSLSSLTARHFRNDHEASEHVGNLAAVEPDLDHYFQICAHSSASSSLLLSAASARPAG